MILSYDYKFIFLKTHKVAGTSLESALCHYCGPKDIIAPFQRGHVQGGYSEYVRGPQNFRIPSFRLPLIGPVYLSKRRFYNHTKASELKPRVPADIWSSFFKFSIIRNPYDREISRYYWHIRKYGVTMDFRDWLFDPSYPRLAMSDIYAIDGKPETDFLVRFEHFEEDLTKVSEKLELPTNLYQIFQLYSAKSGLRDPAASVETMFDGFDDGKRFIEETYSLDFEVGGYEIL